MLSDLLIVSSHIRYLNLYIYMCVYIYIGINGKMAHKPGTQSWHEALTKRQKTMGQTWSSGLHPVSKDGTRIFMGFIIMTEI